MTEAVATIPQTQIGPALCDQPGPWPTGGNPMSTTHLSPARRPCFCRECGVPIPLKRTGRLPIFCSTSCGGKWHRRAKGKPVKDPKPCEHCGVVFQPKPWGREMRFCTTGCREKYWVEQRRRAYPPCPCHICGTVFQPANSQGKYCSKSCAKKAFRFTMRDSWLRRNYGISLDDYYEMLDGQGGACAICRTEEPGAAHRWFSVDHDHDTGAVRGLLCNGCNTGLGRFGDNPVLLQRALEYLT